MRPEFQTVSVDVAKLRDYALSESHLRGRHKARVFLSRLGIDARDADWLRTELIRQVSSEDCVFQPGTVDEHGARYIVDAPISRGHRHAVVRSVWIIGPGSSDLRLTSCYVL